MIFLNARSILSKLDHLNILLVEEKPHILCLTETWCNDSITNAMLNMPNYYIDDELRIDRSDTAQGRGGGLLVYARNDITVKPLTIDNTFNQYCKFQLLRNDAINPLNVTLIYRSPNSTAENTSKLVKLVENPEKNSLIIGDFNLPSMDTSTGASCPKSRLLLEAIEASFLQNCVNFPTHIRGNILDLALNNIGDSIFNCEDLGNLGNSDHSIIKLEIDFSPKFNLSKELIRDWRKGDEEGLKNHIENIDFGSLFQDKDANQCWLSLKDIIESGLDRYIPLTCRRKPGQPPWMNKLVKNLTNKKRRHWKRFKKNRSDLNFENFKQSEKLCKKAVQNAKRRFERNIAKSGNKRPFNSYVKSKTKTRANVGPLKVDDVLISDNKGMAVALNDYFLSVFSKDSAGQVPAMNKLPSRSVLSDLNISSEKV